MSIYKNGIGINVYDAAVQRTEWTFDNFDRIYMSFSAGKDSTVMLHIAADIARKRGRKFGLLLVDLEAQYKLTISHAEKLYEEYADVIEPYWVSLPIALRNAVSVYEPKWLCWDPEKESDWIRTPPDYAITDQSYFEFFHPGMEFEEFVPLFGEWYSNGEKCACMVGIRSDESLNRWRTIASKTKETIDSKIWTTKVTDSVYNVYPVYDWKGRDIWRYHSKFPDKPFNELYEFMHKAGVPLGSMRICQPYGDDQRRGLWLFHIVEPETWAKIVSRVSGANSGALYIQESGNINGYHKIQKPDGHTWKSFAQLFLASLPKKTKEHYENKIALFCKWHEERGYPDGIPDECDLNLENRRDVPSWRRVCKSLLRNDYWCKGLGFSQHKSEAYMKYLDLMRRRKQKWREEKTLQSIEV